MDPLSALGLASAVAQFLDFGSKLFHATKEVMDAGSTVTVARVGEAAGHLADIGCGLQTRYQTLEAAELSEEELSLYGLARQCELLAAEISDCLKSLVAKKGKNARWATFLAALCSVWQREHVETLALRLTEYRSQLTLRLLLVLNSHHDAQNKKLDRLQDSGREIVEVVSISTQDIVNTIHQKHEETMAAIFTARNGTSQAITGHRTGAKFVEQMSRSDLLKTTTTYHHQENTMTGPLLDFSRRPTPPNFSRKLLDSLHFREISYRKESIPQTYRDTFEWVWAPSNPEGEALWDNLGDWLKHGNGCYWLCGKAGSGKSSLMKFLQQDRRTDGYLQEWVAESAGTELITGSFYFWYAGSPVQKSQTGLLRSLLFYFLSCRPEMCPVLFPDVCRSILAGKILTPTVELDHLEIRVAFSRLVDSIPKDVRLFFFVDGLDEYSGDHNDICDLFAEATNAPSIKILVSSRPIQACVAKFSHCPKLHLQDLTRADITLYVKDKLDSDPLMAKMEAYQKGFTTQMIESVTSKACGVFLWVILVVKRLKARLQDYDSVAELEAEIEKLPSDLEKLYEHMLGAMSQEHRVLGSKYLQLVLRSMEMDVELYLLQLSFAEDEDYSGSLTAAIEAIEPNAEVWRCEATEGRLRSRCCGLIETREHRSSLAFSAFNKKVDFIHRTVTEFLRIGVVWDRIRASSGPLFHADEALVSSALREIKALPYPQRSETDCTMVSARIAHMLSYEQALDQTTRETFHKAYLPEFLRVIRFHWHDPALFSSFTEQLTVFNASVSAGCARMKLAYPESFIFACLIQSPEPDLRNHVEIAEIDHRFTAFHMLLHFTEETDIRVRTSMAANIPDSYLTIRECIFSKRNSKDLVKNSRKRLVQGDGYINPSHDAFWGYFIHFLVTIMDHSGEKHVDRSTSSSVIPVLIALQKILEGATFRILPTLKLSSKFRLTSKSKRLNYISLIAEFLWEIWSRESVQAGRTSALDSLALHCCGIETLIRGQDGFEYEFCETLEALKSLKHPKKKASSHIKALFSRFQRKLQRPKHKDGAPKTPEHSDLPVVPLTDYSSYESPWQRYQRVQAREITQG
ncbi:hypothetical protein QBC33DRAFT_201658 [Phialemonium atrogriseum]|uniref:NACHT domain-containing protein n=1 Tax=Phialemonium atrogriseum TaxID=1093897 RepID=A0AAJ0BUF4_9PEZI|nr:uncharacterized protein QBC33DRAFT_201658 [Phialemonium atrogriseum]KAK1764207.1 hypothetical protein QBC33DRAFT_201658 [Phialemonium atrogriseum]